MTFFSAKDKTINRHYQLDMTLAIYSDPDLHNFFNLGFWDKDSSGQIDDKIVTNNSDSQRVLATVASTLYTFTEKFPEAMVLAVGSTKSRTRLYRIGITNNLTEIEEDFEVFRFAQGDWMKFQKQIKFDSFLVKRKFK